MTLRNTIEDSVNNFINPIFSDIYDGINKAMLHVLFVRINFCSCCNMCCISLLYNCIDYLLDETHVRVHFGYSGYFLIIFCNEGKLFTGLREHLLLLICDSLLLFFFLSSDAFLFLSDLFTTALTAPLLTLTRSEVVCPFVTLRAVNLDDSLFIPNNNSIVSTVTLSLHSYCVYNLHTVVADLMDLICELPECNLATIANVFTMPHPSSPSRFLLSDNLLLATLFNSVSGDALFLCISFVCTNIAATLAGSCLRIIVVGIVWGNCRGSSGFWSRFGRGFFSDHISADALGGLGCNMREIRSVGCGFCGHSVLSRLFVNDIYADLCEEVVNFITLSDLIRWLTMLMMMRMLMRIIRSLLVMMSSGVSSLTISGPVFDDTDTNTDIGTLACRLLLSSKSLLMSLVCNRRNLLGLGLALTVAVTVLSCLLGCEMSLLLLGLSGSNDDVLLLSLVHFSCSGF